MQRGEMKGVMIGAGFFAHFHAEAWSRMGGARIAAIADLIPGRAQQFAAQWGISRSYTDAETMIQSENPDFVDIVTRPDSHPILVSLAARQGVHIICQKPMAAGQKDAEAMVETCAKAGVRLLMHENWRWQPWYREVKRLMETGVVGKPYQLAFRMRSGDGLGPDRY